MVFILSAQTSLEAARRVIKEPWTGILSSLGARALTTRCSTFLGALLAHMYGLRLPHLQACVFCHFPLRSVSSAARWRGGAKHRRLFKQAKNFRSVSRGSICYTGPRACASGKHSSGRSVCRCGSLRVLNICTLQLLLHGKNSQKISTIEKQSKEYIKGTSTGTRDTCCALNEQLSGD